MSERDWNNGRVSEGFTLENLPLGVFSSGHGGERRIGVAIGDKVLDVRACADTGLLDSVAPEIVNACREPLLNPLMGLGRDAGRKVRRAVRGLLDPEAPASVRDRARDLLIAAAECTMHVPAHVGDYTDFYASVDHATNVGRLFRPDNPLLPNYKHVPIGYHGRASSIVASGTLVRRPRGQTMPADASEPRFGPSRAMDYEAEIGFYVAAGNMMGESIPIGDAADHIFGFCLVNDWSARDIQSWEYQPLGPFLAKNFATSLSPWVVLSDALEPFRVPARKRGAGDPAPLSYLTDQRDQSSGAIGIVIETWLASARMRDAGVEPVRLSAGSFALMYWTPAQMLAHHASNGCNLLPGDLLASGTVSGPTREERGCLLELTQRGAEPVTLPTGETRAFLEDGDEVVMRGWCRKQGVAALSLGECRGIVVEPGGSSSV